MTTEICGPVSAHWQVVVGLDLPAGIRAVDQLGLESLLSPNACRSTVAGLTARTVSKYGFTQLSRLWISATVLRLTLPSTVVSRPTRLHARLAIVTEFGRSSACRFHDRIGFSGAGLTKQSETMLST
jgi:hypothetical protein